MQYNLTGNFYEACDCAVVCSCWLDHPPPMGSCTGLFVWAFGEGSTIDMPGGTESVNGFKVMLITQGRECDNAENAIVLLSGPDGDSFDPPHLPTETQQKALEAALNETNGPWAKVVNLNPARKDIQNGLIVIKSTENKILIDASGVAIKAKASMVIPAQAVSLQSSDANSFIARSTGNPNGTIDGGWVELDHSSSGLDILATANYAPPPSPPDEYVFDLDITDVSAVKGTFTYTMS